MQRPGDSGPCRRYAEPPPRDVLRLGTLRGPLLPTAATVIIVFLGACADDAELPTSESRPPTSSMENLQPLQPKGPPSAATPGPTLRDEFTAMARRVPGGFGGVYFDDDGVLTILLTDPSLQDEARASLAAEPFIQARANAAGAGAFDIQSAKIAEAAYAHDDLDAWLDGILRSLRDAGVTATKSGVSVHRNRIVVGVGREAQRNQVEDAMDEADVPGDAVIVEVVGPVRPLQSVHDRIRPVPGGVQIQYSGSANCTLGPNMVREPQGHDPEPGYVVASHCSNHPFVSFEEWWDPTTHYFQPTDNNDQSHHIGNKTRDPPLFDCVEDPDGCRNSDAALGLYPGYASGELGYIARPASRNDDTYALDPTDPRFEITGVFHWSLDGETLEKVGRTTGWSGGKVIDGCFTFDATSYSIRCAMSVDARAGTGDSGSPVFKMVSGTQVQLRGTLFARTDEATCTTGVDPIYPIDQLYCDQFVASNLGGILWDLDPDGLAPLTFH